MKLFNYIEITPEEYSELNAHIQACYYVHEWNAKPETERIKEITEYIEYLRTPALTENTDIP